MTSAANSNIGYAFTYDPNNRLISVLDSNNKTISYQYNGLNQRTQMITPDGRTITYGYNTGNRLSQISSPVGGFNIAYDNAGRRTGLSYPNGVTTVYSYNPSSFLTSLLARNFQQTTINSYSYTHDNMGNRTSMTDLSGVHNYVYDDIYQLTRATHPGIPMEQFAYDAVGNRMSSEEQPPALGRSTDFTYDFENRLIEVNYLGMVAQYKYDPFGRRIQKNVNGDITTYVYDGPNIVSEYDGNGNVTNAYIHNLAVDDPLSLDQGGKTSYYLKDGLGSVTELTNSSGSVEVSYKYEAFGAIYSQTGTLVQPFTFTGREYDSESGLYYYRARYYDPRAGRFLTKDPIGFAAGDVNRYRYVGNNPINFADPWGQYGWDVHYYKTYIWAKEVGIEPTLAKIIAEANQSVDDLLFQDPHSILSLFVGGLRFHFPFRGTTELELMKCAKFRQVEEFGRQLHMLQDSFSHAGIGPLTHIKLLDAPDKYDENNPRDQEMEQLTKWYLRELKKSLDNAPFK
jgi:RHS repeat-associated protein